MAGFCWLVEGGKIHVDGQGSVDILPDLVAELGWKAENGWFRCRDVSMAEVLI